MSGMTGNGSRGLLSKYVFFESFLTCRYLLMIKFQTINDTGIDKTASVMSDSTGNTKAGHHDAQCKMPTLLNLGNCCHHIQNTVKNINDIPEFHKASNHIT